MKLKLKMYGLILLGGVLSVPLVLLACSFIPRRWTSSVSKEARYEVCVTQLDIHTNIVLPVSTDAFDWGTQFPLALKNEQYVGFGWGERVWYMNPPSQPLEVLVKGSKAMLLQNAAAVQVHKYEKFPDYFNYRCVKVERSQYLALIEFIKDSFQLDAQGKPIAIANPTSPNDFYEGTGRYSFLNNSNHWTAKGLRRAEVNTPLWAGFSFAIMNQLNGVSDRSTPKAN